MIRLTTLLCCIGLICAAPFNEKVVGGTEAEPHSWKYQVSLQTSYYGDESDYYHICGGSLIDAFYVLTAAHCVSVDGKYRVVVGEHDLYEDGGTEQFIAVEKVIIHPGWTMDLGNGNDIALLKLANTLYDNGFVELASLPGAGETLPQWFTCYVTGWGLLGSNGEGSPEKLQVAPLNVVEHSICSQPEWWGGLAKESMVCAGGDGITAGCNGDSGGPLSCKTEDDDVFRVHGVVSYGAAGMCSMVNKPTVFTRVSYFVDWIYKEIGIYSQEMGYVEK